MENSKLVAGTSFEDMSPTSLYINFLLFVSMFYLEVKEKEKRRKGEKGL